MVEIERTLIVDRPVAEVFAYLCDFEHGPGHIAGQQKAHQTSTGPVSIGTTFVTTSSKFPHRGTSFEIIEYQPERRLAWKARSGARTTTRWGFQPAGNKTRIAFTRVIEASHGLLRLPEWLVLELTNERVSRELAALSKLLDVPALAPRPRIWGGKHEKPY